MTSAPTLSRHYQQRRAADTVAEEYLFDLPPDVPEMEVQACWFAGAFGRQFTTTDGLPVEILGFGEWNRGAGPDFLGATIKIGDEPARQGAIELDRTVRDWEQHGHAKNPTFDRVLLHLHYQSADGAEHFVRTSQHEAVPQVRLHLDQVQPVPEEWAREPASAHCCAPLASRTRADVEEFLQEAAAFRLERKQQHLQRLSLLHGDDEALFQTLAAILGYRGNKVPFTLLAQRLPLEWLRQAPDRIEARLFGLGGFLDPETFDAAPEDSRRWLSGLWNQWWQDREGFAPRTLNKRAWTLTGTRPANHPQRRLAALACLARDWPACRQALNQGDFDALTEWAATIDHPFWRHHYTLLSKPSERPMALIGPSRVAEIAANLTIPLHFDRRLDFWSFFASMRTVPVSSRVRLAALRLFGTEDPDQVDLRLTLHQQGLLQIFEDYCLPAGGDCLRCRLPARVG